VTAYDDLISYRFAGGKGYDKQSVETFRAMALNQVDELLHQLTALQDSVATTGSATERQLVELARMLPPHERERLVAELTRPIEVAPAAPAGTSDLLGGAPVSDLSGALPIQVTPMATDSDGQSAASWLTALQTPAEPAPSTPASAPGGGGVFEPSLGFSFDTGFDSPTVAAAAEPAPFVANLEPLPEPTGFALPSLDGTVEAEPEPDVAAEAEATPEVEPSVVEPVEPLEPVASLPAPAPVLNPVLLPPPAPLAPPAAPLAPPNGLRVVPGLGESEPEPLTIGNEALEELFAQLDFGAPSPEVLADATAAAPRPTPHLTVVSNDHPVAVGASWATVTELPQPEQPWRGWLSR
jgi:hypothetical protein